MSIGSDCNTIDGGGLTRSARELHHTFATRCRRRTQRFGHTFENVPQPTNLGLARYAPQRVVVGK